MRKIISLLLLTVSFQQLFACDICGCSSGNYFLGPTPQFNKFFIGLRYSFRSYNTILKNSESQFSKDFYQTAELWGGFKIKKKFQLLAFVPYSTNHSRTDDGKKTNKGLGDISIIGSYKLFDKISLNKDTQTVSQQLWIGGGVKLPTATFSLDRSELVASANSQTGTGSFDFLVTAAYTLIIENLGFTSNLNYKINQSAFGFKFGNRFTSTVFAFRSFLVKKNTLSPNIGLLYENLNPDQLYKNEIENTGGNALLTAVGLETGFDKVMLGFNVQLPVVQNISDSQTKINIRGMLHLTYTF